MAETGWVIDRSKSIGHGSFGQVFEATDPLGHPIAAKVVPKTDADRDLLAVDLPASEHLVPVLHVSELDREIVLFMPRAEMSLRDRLAADQSLGVQEALQILQQVAAGLVAMGGTLVHRDLKPENILLLDGVWAICDFGISRYAEASTAVDTRKFSMTPAYAAPEQWRHEHSTSSTDIYAFGVIAYELLGGERPFPGPSVDDYRKQHLEDAPAALATTRKLASLVTECLFKGAEARPTPSNLLARLNAAGRDANTPGASALAEAHQAVVESVAAELRAAEVARTEAQRRKTLFDAAKLLFAQIIEDLLESIEDGAPTATIVRGVDSSGMVELARARMNIAAILPSGPTLPFDVIAYSSISLRDQGGLGRSHSLYYANFEEEHHYKWYELAFSSTLNADFDREPRALSPGEAMQAFERVFGSIQLGRRIAPLDIGLLEDFIDEWSERLGDTAVGRFPRVHQLPEGNPVLPAWR